MGKYKSKRIKKEIIEKLKHKCKLNYNPGKIIIIKFNINRKDKKHSGRITPRILKPKMKYSNIIKAGLEPSIFYDDWLNYRDGKRDFHNLEIKKKNISKTKQIKCARKGKLKIRNI